MAKIPTYTEVSVVDLKDLLYLVDVSDTTDDATGSSRKITLERLFGIAGILPGGRLTTSSSLPVSEVDSPGITTLYYMSYLHNLVPLWDGSRWITFSLPTIGIALGTLSNDVNYDVFLFSSTATPSSTNTSTNIVTFASTPSWITGGIVTPSATIGGLTAGTTYYYRAISSTTGAFYTTISDALLNGTKVDLTADITQSLRAVSAYFVAWSGNTRVTPITLQDGRYCLSGDKPKLYIGTFRTTATTTTEDSKSKRFLWNMYNRVQRPLSVVDTTYSWVYTTDTWRSANNSTANRVQMVRGLDEDAVTAHVQVLVTNSTETMVACGVGVSSVSANSAQLWGNVSKAAGQSVVASYNGLPGYGFHYLQWLEKSAAVGSNTFYGNNGGSVGSGLIAEGWF